jgi:hypothetical protein
LLSINSVGLRARCLAFAELRFVFCASLQILSCSLAPTTVLISSLVCCRVSQKYLSTRLLEGSSRSEHTEKALIGKLKVTFVVSIRVAFA